MTNGYIKEVINFMYWTISNDILINKSCSWNKPLWLISPLSLESLVVKETKFNIHVKLLQQFVQSIQP